MKSTIKKILFLTGLFLVVFTLFEVGKLNNVSHETSKDISFYLEKLSEKREKELILAQKEEEVKEKEKKETAEEVEESASPEVDVDEDEGPVFPLKKILKVPFIVQAPYQNWDIHRESCEEAAFLILLAYKKGERLANESADKELRVMKKFQAENYGKEKDLIGQDFIKFAQDYANIELKTIDLSLENIKRIINAGNPIIVPVTAKLLQNPYYPHPGYHMIVIIGYNGDTIITNDPGTYRGEGFEYPFERIKKAATDYGGISFY